MLNERERVLKEDKRKNDLFLLRLRQKELELKKGVFSNLSGFLESSRKELENLVKELREQGVSREKTLKVKTFIEQVTDKKNTSDREISEETAELREIESEISEESICTEEIREGLEVLVMPSRSRGEVLRKLKGNTWLVACGSLKLSVEEHDLEVAKKGKSEKVPFCCQ